MDESHPDFPTCLPLPDPYIPATGSVHTRYRKHRLNKEANQALGAFIETWEETPLVEFDRLIETLLEWGDEIFAFHDTDRATNGRIEGTNGKLGVLKRVAYGFVNVANFAARALLLTPGMPTSP